MNRKSYISPELEIEKFTVAYTCTISGGLEGGDTDITVPDDEF